MSKLAGCIGFSGSKHPDFFGRAIKFFSNSRWSHAFIVFFEQNGEDSVIEASRVVQVVPLSRYQNDPDMAYEIYSIKGLDPVVRDNALLSVFKDHAGEVYGFLQILWFIWRWMNELIGRKIGKEANWFPEGAICSELQFDYDRLTTQAFKDLLWNSPTTENTTTPEDLYKLVTSHPQLFHLEESKNP